MSLFKTIQSIFAPKPPSRYPMDEKPGPFTTDQLNERKAYFDKMMEASKRYAKDGMAAIGNPDAFKDFGPINKYKQLPPTPAAQPIFNKEINLDDLLAKRMRGKDLLKDYTL